MAFDVGDPSIRWRDVPVSSAVLKYLDWHEANDKFWYTLAGSRVRHDFWIWEKDGIIEHPDEQVFEFIDLFETVDAARDTFTMCELGAGFGRWLVAGAAAAQTRGLKVNLIGVEAEHAHFEMMRQHFIDNGINPDTHTLIKAAVTAEGAPAYFTQGHSREWWGQGILPAPDLGFGDWPQATVERVHGVSLSSILAPLQKIDFIDMDIQGAEFDVLASAKTRYQKSPACTSALTAER